VLAAWESVIGLGLIAGRWLRASCSARVQMSAITARPVPADVHRLPPVPTLEGQYIIKNLVIIAPPWPGRGVGD
jgi:hypothetical protein